MLTECMCSVSSLFNFHWLSSCVHVSQWAFKLHPQQAKISTRLICIATVCYCEIFTDDTRQGNYCFLITAPPPPSLVVFVSMCIYICAYVSLPLYVVNRLIADFIRGFYNYNSCSYICIYMYVCIYIICIYIFFNLFFFIFIIFFPK